MADALCRQMDVQHAADHEAHQAGDHHDSKIDFAQQARQHWHHQKGRHAGDQHHPARLLRVVSGDQTKKLRYQIDDGIEHRADHQHDENDAGITRVAQQAQAHHGTLGGELRDRDQHHAGQRQQAQPDDHVGLEPTLALAFLQHHCQRAETRRKSDDAQPVGLLERIPTRMIHWQSEQQQCHQTDTHWQVDEKAPAPADVFREPTAQYRTQQRSEQHNQAKDRHADR